MNQDGNDQEPGGLPPAGADEPDGSAAAGASGTDAGSGSGSGSGSAAGAGGGSDTGAGDRPAGPGPGGSGTGAGDRPAGAGPGGGGPGGGGPGGGDVGDGGNGAEPAGLLVEVRRLRRQARAARHAYWFPLVLFGVLTCASVPFYIQPPARSGVFISSGPFLPVFGGFASPGLQRNLAYYWLAALVVGLALTGFWYRRHGRRVGVATPARGYLVTGTILIFLGLLPWLISHFSGRYVGYLAVLPGDLIVRGTFPFVIIAVGLWVLALAERSWGLLVITVIYTGTALLASLYDIENVLFRLGWNPTGYQWRLTSLPNVLLPALVLIVAGAAAFAVQRRQRSLA